jgi:hypothetical protein
MRFSLRYQTPANNCAVNARDSLVKGWTNGSQK